MRLLRLPRFWGKLYHGLPRPGSSVFGGWFASGWRRLCSSTAESLKESDLDTSLLKKHLISKIKSTGPISIAEYMREVLTNPATGYYCHSDVLGAQGDFITSPEISQIFGELLGVWCVSEWIAAGKPKTFQLVEFGPGRGTLTSDVIKVFSQLSSVLSKSEISVHLVEVSPKLSEVQAQLLTEGELHLSHNPSDVVYKTGGTKTGLPIFWYRDLQDVPKGFSFYLAHEFFDALPIHKFQRTQKGWRELLIDVEPKVSNKLRFVLAPSDTLASKTLIQRDEERDHVEICAEAGVIIHRLASRIAEDGGAALIADYGHNGTKTDTFRSFRGHKLHDVLTAPGTADLTADVDFSYLQKMVEGKVASLGPISQQRFLKNMGIDVRLQVLQRNTNDPVTRKQLLDGYDMIMNPERMGERFQFFTLLPHSRLVTSVGDKRTEKPVARAPPVAGFSELQF